MDSICYNGQFFKKNDFSLKINNRGFQYGDSFFETIKCYKGVPFFFEEHYFRIAASFCILKMNTPPTFSMESLQSLIQELLIKNSLNNYSARIRISFFRKAGGYYSPDYNDVNFIIESMTLNSHKYQINHPGLIAGLYKDNFLPKHTIGNIKSNNKIVNVLASIFARDMDYDDCVLINQDKCVVESISGNLFIVQNGTIKTTALEHGCVDGVLRKILLNNKNLIIEECIISISDLFNADEVFFTNVISGVRWVSSINNNNYSNDVSKKIIKLLNENYL